MNQSNRIGGVQMFVRAYLRASTKEQDARRAKEELRSFAKDRELKIATYRERERGMLIGPIGLPGIDRGKYR
jgi:hypothetical protein